MPPFSIGLRGVVLFKHSFTFTIIGILMVLRLLMTAVSVNRETEPLQDITEHTNCIIHRGKSSSSTNIEHQASNCKTPARFTKPLTRGTSVTADQAMYWV
jgi:hypothetical protein